MCDINRFFLTDVRSSRHGELYLEVGGVHASPRGYIFTHPHLSFIAVHIPRMVLLRFPFFPVQLLTRRAGSIKKGNRKAEILLRDVEVGEFSMIHYLDIPDHLMPSTSQHGRLSTVATNLATSTPRRRLTACGKKFF